MLSQLIYFAKCQQYNISKYNFCYGLNEIL